MIEPEDAYELVEPFDIDDGQLAGVSPTVAFCLGAEFIQFRARLLGGKPFTDIVLADNAARVVAMAERHGRFVESRPAENGWASVTVGGTLDG